MSRNIINLLAQLIALLVLIDLTSACGSIGTPAISTPTATPTPTVTRVLFIGNSLTVNNDLPGMFAKLAQSGNHVVEVDVSSAGGGTWEGHAKSGGATFGKLGRKKWDFVVLQEQSDYPAIAALRESRVYPAARCRDDRST